MKKLLHLFVMFLLPIVANADAVLINGIYYNLNTETKVAEVTSNPNKYKGNVVIPTSITVEGVNFSVEIIADFAFKGCSDLTSITIPDGMKSIGQYAFHNCSGLTSIDVPNSVGSMGRYAFSRCTSLTSFSIPNSMISIDSYVFSECTGLITVNIPNSVRTIGAAFDGCTALTTVNIPNSVESLAGTFNSCSSLKFINIPNSVETIGKNTFSWCTSLTSIVIGNNVKTIKDAAFSGCPQLSDVYCYAESVPSTKSDAFEESLVKHPTLHVPASAISNYEAASPWKNFSSIVVLAAGDPMPTSIKTAVNSITDKSWYYDLNGRQVAQPKKGVMITNGKKVLIK